MMIDSPGGWIPSVRAPVVWLMFVIGAALVLVYYGSSGMGNAVIFDPSPVSGDPSELLEDARYLDSGPATAFTFHGRSKFNGVWWVMKGLIEGYAFSAFYDDRKSLSTLPVIRIIAVTENVDNRPIYCVVFYDLRPTPERMEMKKLPIGAGIGRHGRNFKEYVFTCPLQDEDIPDNVSIVIRREDQPSFQMPVEIPRRPKIKENFVVCVSVTYWKQDVYRIIEWMELLRILGASKVTIYNNSLEALPAQVFQYYDQKGFVDFRQSHSFVPDAGELTIHMHMSPVINDCMYRNMHSFRKVIVTDLDEIIVPRTSSTYAEMLAKIDQSQPSSHPAKHYVFENDYFFFDIPNAEDNSQSEHTKTLRFRKRLPPSGPGYSVKSIIDPQACTNMHNHFCWGNTDLYEREGKEISVSAELGLNQHYKKCHFDQWEHPGRCAELFQQAVQDDIMLTHATHLTESMNLRLEDLHFQPL